MCSITCNPDSKSGFQQGKRLSKALNPEEELEMAEPREAPGRVGHFAALDLLVRRDHDVVFAAIQSQPVATFTHHQRFGPFQISILAGRHRDNFGSR